MIDLMLIKLQKTTWQDLFKRRNITIRIKEKVPETFRTKFKKLLYKPSENKELNDEDLTILKMHIYSDYSKFKKLITNKNS